MDINDINSLRQRAIEIQDASEKGENTAYRVGSLLKDLIDYTGEQTEEIHAIDNIIISLSNQNMPIGTDDEGTASYYSNSCKLEVFRNGTPMTLVSGIPTGSEEYAYTIGNIERSDGRASTGISASAVSNKVVVSVSTINNFTNVNAYVPITVSFADGITRDAVITLFGVGTGQSGQIVDMYMNTAVIRTDYYYQNVVPETIEVGVKIGTGTDVSLYPSGDPDESAESKGYTFTYFYNGDKTSEESFTGSLVPLAGQDYESLTIQMYYEEQTIDSQTISYVRDGAPGIGSTDYKINILSTSVTKETADNSVSGTITFTVNKTKDNDTIVMTESPWADSDNEKLIIKTNNKVKTAVYDLQESVWKIDVDIQGDSYTEGYDYTQILLTTATSTLLVSAVVPYIISNNKQNVQEVGGVVTRFRNFDDLANNQDGLGDVGIGVGASYEGTVYKDIIIYLGNYYYVAPTYTGSLAPQDIHNILPVVGGQIQSPWVYVQPMSDAAFQTMIAKQGFIENLTAHEIVITNDDQSPVAGMTRGEAVEGDGDAIDGVSRGNIRIWAGSPYKQGEVANLTNCPFYATDEGFVHAENAEISGTIEAKNGHIGGFNIGEDKLYNTAYNASIEITNSGNTQITKIGKTATDIITSQSCALQAENTNGGTYSTALYLNASGASYNYAFHGNGNGVLNGLMFGFKTQVWTMQSGTTEQNEDLNIKDGSTIIIKGSHNSGFVNVGAPKLSEVKQSLGLSTSSEVPFAIEISILNYSNYEHTRVCFRSFNDHFNSSENPYLMDTNDNPIISPYGTPTIQIAQGDYLKLLLTYVRNTSNVLEYRAYKLIYID